MLKAHFVHEHEAYPIFRLHGFHKRAAQFYDPLGVTFGGVDAFFAAPAHAFHGPPPGRATQGQPVGRRQSRPHLVQRRVGPLAQINEQLRPARRVQTRRGTAARRQGRDRTRRALATQELVDKGDGNTEPRGHLVNPAPRFAASGHHAFP